MGFFIPETLKKINNWVVWKKEGQKYVKKVPYNPKTGRRANPTKSCCCYDDAINFYKYGGSFDGIGFCFTPNCNMTFIDLDNCIQENGEETELAKQLQIMFADCYMEYSQSEQGIHIICIGSIPRAIKTPEIEIYSKDRYVALTGNNLNFNEPKEAQKRLNKLFDKYSKNYSNNLLTFKSVTKISLTTSAKDINALIQIIKRSKQGEKWQKLHHGNIYGYKSTSEAAQAYIAIVNYFANGNEKLIKILFSLSQFPHINKKYKEDYYINRMITNAQNSLTYKNTYKRLKVNTKNRNQLDDIKETKRKHF